MTSSEIDANFRAFAESRGLIDNDLETMWRIVRSRNPEDIAGGFGLDATRLVSVLIDYVSASPLKKG